MNRRTTALFCSVDISEPPVTFWARQRPNRTARSRHWPCATVEATVWGRRAGWTSRSAATPRIGGVCVCGGRSASRSTCCRGRRDRRQSAASLVCLRDLRGVAEVVHEAGHGVLEGQVVPMDDEHPTLRLGWLGRDAGGRCPACSPV